LSTQNIREHPESDKGGEVFLIAAQHRGGVVGLGLLAAHLSSALKHLPDMPDIP
jgi:hypothetical protein